MSKKLRIILGTILLLPVMFLIGVYFFGYEIYRFVPLEKYSVKLDMSNYIYNDNINPEFYENEIKNIRIMNSLFGDKVLIDEGISGNGVIFNCGGYKSLVGFKLEKYPTILGFRLIKRKECVMHMSDIDNFLYKSNSEAVYWIGFSDFYRYVYSIKDKKIECKYPLKREFETICLDNIPHIVFNLKDFE